MGASLMGLREQFIQTGMLGQTSVGALIVGVAAG